LDRQWVEAGRPDRLVPPLEGDHWLRREAADQLDLFLEAPCPVLEVLAEPLVLNPVPADADAQPEAAAGQHVDLDRLLGDERGLPLRQDDHAGDELELRRDAGDEAEQGERLVEHRLVRVRARPTRIAGGVGAEHVVVGEQVLVAHFLGRLGVGPHAADVGADFVLREDDASLHAVRRTPSLAEQAEPGAPKLAHPWQGRDHRDQLGAVVVPSVQGLRRAGAGAGPSVGAAAEPSAEAAAGRPVAVARQGVAHPAAVGARRPAAAGARRCGRLCDRELAFEAGPPVARLLVALLYRALLGLVQLLLLAVAWSVARPATRVAPANGAAKGSQSRFFRAARLDRPSV